MPSPSPLSRSAESSSRSASRCWRRWRWWGRPLPRAWPSHAPYAGDRCRPSASGPSILRWKSSQLRPMSRGASKVDQRNGRRPAGSTYARVYAVVRRVPAGRVATYGQVARVAGLGEHARMVGYALAALPNGTTVPWHRVINAQGTVSRRRSGDSLSQRMRLEREGVRFDARGRASFARFGWRPRGRGQSRAP